jgi:hypothetical protein
MSSNWVTCPPGLTAHDGDDEVLAISPENGVALLTNGKLASLSHGVSRQSPINWVPAPDGWRAAFGFLQDEPSDDEIVIMSVVSFGLPSLPKDGLAEYDSDYAVVSPEWREFPVTTSKALREASNITRMDYLVPPGEDPPVEKVREELDQMRKRAEERRARAAPDRAAV